MTTIPDKMASTQGTQGPSIIAIASVTTGTVSAALTQNRCLMSASSGLASEAAAGAIGSNAIPQMGQSPGPSRRTSGCIGQAQPVEPLAPVAPLTEAVAGAMPPRRPAPR